MAMAMSTSSARDPNLGEIINQILDPVNPWFSERAPRSGSFDLVKYEFVITSPYGQPPLFIGCGVRPCSHALASGFPLCDGSRDSVSDSCRLREQRLFRRAVRGESPLVSMTELRASAFAPFCWTPSCASSAFSLPHWSSFSTAQHAGSAVTFH